MIEILLTTLLFTAAAGDAKEVSPAPAPVPAARPLCGGYQDAALDSPEVTAAAQFAVTNQAPGAELVKIVAASQQVVAGMNYKLTLKIKTADGEKTVDTVVYRHFKGEMKVSDWKLK